MIQRIPQQSEYDQALCDNGKEKKKAKILI